MKWLKNLFRRKPKQPSGTWLLWYEPEGQERVITGEFRGSASAAMDAAQTASVNFMWKSGMLDSGAVMGAYGIDPVPDALPKVVLKES